VGGTQNVAAAEFLKPSDYNKLFERFSVVSAGATALMDSNDDLNKLRALVDRWRNLSLKRLKSIAGLNASEDEKKLLKKEGEMAKMALPNRLGDGVMSSSARFVRAFDRSLAKTLGQE
jgi:hypothetical protein